MALWVGLRGVEQREEERKDGRKKLAKEFCWEAKEGGGSQGRGVQGTERRGGTGFTSERAGRVTRVSVSLAAQLITTFSPWWQGAREQRLEGKKVNRAEKPTEGSARKEKAEVRKRERKRKEEEEAAAAVFESSEAGN